MMQPYPSYKDSGVEWIGKIPREWRLVRIGYISELLTGFPFKSEDFDFIFGIKILRGENVSEGFLRWGSRTRKWKNLDYDKKYELKENDVVIGMDGSKVGKNFVKIINSDLPLLLHQRMCRLRLKEDVDPNLVTYHIGSNMFRYYVNISKTDPMIPHITQKNIYDFKLPIPIKGEQQQISNFLDRKTKQIDELIEKTQQKIKLLKEKRTSLINHCVTKGLDPNAEMKDSGVEWIGEIPREWRFIELKFILDLLTDFESNGSFKSVKENVKVFDEGEIWYVRMTDLEKNNLGNENCKWINESSYKFLTKTKLFGNELLVTKRGEIGKVYLFPKVDMKCSLGPNSYLLRLSDSNFSPFYYYFLESDYGQISLKLIDKSTTIGAIYKDDLKDLRVIVPPLPEQQQIVNHLDKEIQKIDTLIEKENQRTDLLKEYRQSLISEVVTGKIDVRNEVLQ